MKTCSKCRAARTRDEFHVDKTTRDGLKGQCKSCVSRCNNPRYTTTNPAVTQKVCAQCNLVKAAKEFSKHKSTRTGLRSTCRSCESLTRTHRRQEDLRKRGYRALNDLLTYNPAGRRVFDAYKNNAEIRGLKFFLTPHHFMKVLSGPCDYCGRIGGNKSKARNHVFEYTGIDRVDNSQGYELHNVVPCCRLCNVAKNNLPLEEFLLWSLELAINTWGEVFGEAR